MTKRGHVHEDRPDQPQLLELVRRLNGKLQPFFKNAPYCTRGWANPLRGHFLPGCAGEPQCQSFGTLAAAKAACELLREKCGGVVHLISCELTKAVS